MLISPYNIKMRWFIKMGFSILSKIRFKNNKLNYKPIEGSKLSPK